MRQSFGFLNKRTLLFIMAIANANVNISIYAAETVVLVAGGGHAVGRDGPAAQVKLNGPFGIDRDGEGNWIFVELAGNRVGKISAQGLVSTIAGTGGKGDRGDGGPGLKAEFNGPHSLAIGPDGSTAYIADTWNHRVRKVDLKTGRVGAAFGTLEKGDSGDGGPASQARLGDIYCIAMNPQKTKVILTDLDNRKVRVVDLATGIISLAAGNGRKGVPKDGESAREAPLVDPRAAIADADGNLYVLERGGHALRIVDREGKIRTVVNVGGQRGDRDRDNGDARSAQLNGPKHLCLDRDGGVIIADTENHKIRKYSPNTGKIAVIAGTGRKGTAGVGGPPRQVELAQPHGVFVASNGDLYIVDSANDRILKILSD